MSEINEIKEEIKNLKPFQMIMTDESYFEGLNTVYEYINNAVEKGVSSLAIIDRNSMGMSIKFYKKCLEKKIKPIIGTTLSLDCPFLDYQDNVIKNQHLFSKINKLVSKKPTNGSTEVEEKTTIFKELELNAFMVFADEERYNSILNLKKDITKFENSKSKVKVFELFRNITKFFESINLKNKNLSEIGILNKVEIYYLEEFFKSNFLEKNHTKLLDPAFKNLLKDLLDDNINNDSLKNKEKKNLEKIKFFDENENFIEDVFEELKGISEVFSSNIDYIKKNIKNYSKEWLMKIYANENNYHIDFMELIDAVKNIDEKIDRGDIIALAISDDGVQNLRDLITLAFKEGQRKIRLETDGKRPMDSFPLTSIENLIKLKKGLVIMTTTDKNDIVGQNVVKRNRNGENVAKYLKSQLGDNYVIGIKKSTIYENNNYKEEETKLIESMLTLADDLDIPCIATHDVRFTNKDEYNIFDIKKAILLNEVQYDPSRNKNSFSGQYLLTDEEMINKFANYPELLLNNEMIKNETNFKLKLDFNVLPEFPIPEDFSRATYIEYFKSINQNVDEKLSIEEMKEFLMNFYSEEIKLKHPEHFDIELNKKVSNIVAGKYMDFLAWDGIVEKMKIDYGSDWEVHKPTYFERFKYESDIINKMGFPGYFLIVYDFIRYAKKEANVPVGPGRGSGAGSLIAYGLDITDVDPIPTDLFFERFLNPERVSMPDFDIDFSRDGRELIINYVKEKYGEVSQIATQGRLKPKSVLRNICKALGHTTSYEDDIMAFVSDNVELKISDLENDEEFLEKMSKEVGLYDKIQLAKYLEGKKSSSGVHAGGVVVAPKSKTSSLTSFSAIQQAPDGGSMVVQFDKKDVEIAGLVKFDFLGLKTLDVIKETIEQIEDVTGITLNIRTINKQDKKTFDLLHKALTHGVFQLESGGMTDLVKKLQVDNIEEMSALVALFRPGPMQSGMTNSFVERKNGIEKIEFMHPKLEKALSYTYGTMIYQEQVMQASQILANYTLGGADELRRAMGKKEISEMIKNKAVFNNGAINHNRADANEEAKSIFGYNLDVNLLELAEKNILNLKKYISDDGYFYHEEKVRLFLLEENILSEEEVELYFSKINNKHFRIENMYPNGDKILSGEQFNQEFFNLSLKIRNTLSNKFDKNLQLSDKVYYSLTQYSRYAAIFFKIEQFAAYGFNKAHSYSYAVIAYQTAYLKANHTKEFFAAHLTYQADKLELIDATIQDMEKNFNINLLSPCVNKSFNKFKSEKDGVRYGFGALKGLGETGLTIEKERLENGNFISLTDLIFRIDYRNQIEGIKNTKMSKRGIEALLYSGALDSFLPDDFNGGRRLGRHILLKEYDVLTDVGIYPKEEINEIVEYRLKNGEYNKEVVYNGDPKFNPLQNIACKVIAYAKTEEDIFYDKNEKKEIKEKIKSEKKDFALVIKDLGEQIKLTEKCLSKDDLKVYRKITKEYSNLVNNNVNLSEIEYSPLIVDLENSVQFDDLAKSTFETTSNNILNLFNDKNFKEDFLVSTQAPLLQLAALKRTLSIFKKIDLIKGLPDGLDGLPFYFSNPIKFEKVKNVITHIKENNPNEFTKFMQKIKKDVAIDVKYICEQEKEFAGVYISGHPVDINNASKRFSLERQSIDIGELIAMSKNKELEEEVQNGNFNIIGVVNDFTVRKIKTGANIGKEWVSMVVQDKTGTIKVTMFSELFEKAKDYISEGNVLAFGVVGKISEDWGFQLTANEFKSYLPDMGDQPFFKYEKKDNKRSNSYN